LLLSLLPKLITVACRNEKKREKFGLGKKRGEKENKRKKIEEF